MIIGKTSTGTTVRQISGDHAHIDFQRIKSIGVKNILDIESHRINTVLNSRSHLIKFSNGGELIFSYNSKGELIDFKAQGIAIFVNQYDEVLADQGSNKEG